MSGHVCGSMSRRISSHSAGSNTGWSRRGELAPLPALSTRLRILPGAVITRTVSVLKLRAILRAHGARERGSRADRMLQGC